jgi:hypothetical protein
LKTSHRNAAIATLSIAVLGYAGLRLSGVFDRQKPLPRAYTAAAVCLACGTEAAVSVDFRKPPPLPCARCGAAAVFPWMYCPTCKLRFVPAPEKDEEGVPRRPVVPVCPNCGGAGGTSFDPADESQVVERDAPLPPWP